MKAIALILLVASTAYSQTKSAKLSISGSVKVYFGQVLAKPDEATVELLPIHKITSTDSLGNYQFNGLDSGNYSVQVTEYHFIPQAFKIKLTSQPVTNFDLTINANCSVDAETARSDIERNEPRLLLIGGIAPVAYLYGTKPEKKYGFRYHDFGCTPPAEECVVQYNAVIFQYLDRKFGEKWRKEVRQDVIGFNQK